MLTKFVLFTTFAVLVLGYPPETLPQYPPATEPEVVPPYGVPPPPGPPPPGQLPPYGAPPAEHQSPQTLASLLVNALIDASYDHHYEHNEDPSKPPSNSKFFRFFAKEFVYRRNGNVHANKPEDVHFLKNPERFADNLRSVQNAADYLNGNGFTFEIVAYNRKTVYVTVLEVRGRFRIVSFDEFRQYDFDGGY
ncbi:unnamed protein product [Caenorhabditis angaria]|uniref:Uncharacterized protein n=1 Tax=Caenorhabditis angaria TaxID=860376 RepID=A0A9P1N0T5_9PELO|nr:unnamed protein product [Caenorhabditis angaria]